MPVSLEDIQNLSVEVKALVDAGLPLETHLAEAGTAHGKRLQQLTESISKDLQNGVSLEDSIRESKTGAPRMLAAAIAAGIRSGELGASVEMLGNLADDIIELRRRILQSISYPLTVVALAVVLFCVFIRGFLGKIRWLMDDVTSTPSPFLTQLLNFDAEYWWWPIIVPVAGAIGLVVWFVSGRAASMSFSGPERLMFFLPGVRGMVRDLRFYNLSRMLWMLVERKLPLNESLLLAGACSGSTSLDQACQQAAGQVEKGSLPEPSKTGVWTRNSLPPLLAASLRHSATREIELPEHLASVAGYYRRRLQISIAWLRNIVPVAMFTIVGGGTVVLYSLTVFWPVTEIYRLLAPQ